MEGNNLNNTTSTFKNLDFILIVITVAAIVALSLMIWLKPDESLSTLGLISNTFVENTVWFFMPFPIVIFALSVWWAFSKYGKLKLGDPDTQPDYSMFKYVAMIVVAGLGSGTCVLGFVEWTFYYTDPPFGIEAFTTEAAEMSTAYILFHWGWTVQCCNLLFTIPICYAYYVRKNCPSFRMGDVFGVMYEKDNVFKRFMVRFINLIVMFCIIGGLCCTLGLGVPILSKCLMELFGFTNITVVNIVLVIVISVIFSFSSYLGLQKGLSKMAGANAYWAIAFALILLILGPTVFILSNFVNGFGLMLDNFAHMSFYLDPIKGEGFPTRWTVFYYAWAWAFSAMTSIFTIKLSKGRTFRQMILTTIFIGPAGIWMFLGILDGYSMNLELTGVTNISSLVAEQGNHVGALEAISHFPLGPVVGIAAFFIMAILFLSTTLDAASLALATSSTKNLAIEEEPKPYIRLFWCLMLCLIPIAFTSINAPFDALQNVVNLVSLPIMLVGIYLWVKTFKWIKQDQG